jgi:hypothetical protein
VRAFVPLISWRWQSPFGAMMRRAGGAREAPPPYHIRLDDVAVGERIGGGALGEVRVGEHDGNAVALK